MTFFSDGADQSGLAADRDDVAVERAERARERRTWLGWLFVGIAFVIVLALSFSPSPYVIEAPGPVYDTLGTVGDDETPLIDIPSETTYETSGTLDLLTVSVLGSPSGPANLFEVAVSWFDPSRSIVPLESVFPAGVTTDDQREQSRIQMENSQQEAVAAALTELDYEIPNIVSVGVLLDGSPAEGVLEEGDVITSVNGAAVDGLTDLRDKLSANGAGTPAQIGIERDGDETEVEVTPQEREGTVALGVGVVISYTFPFDVDIELPNVGGPSAGMMFALGIYDKLTPGELTGGASVAGTGTIDAEGTVGPIGGIRQKLYGAERAGASVFLAPQSNCDEVVGHIPAGLDVVSVETLDDAITALDALAGGAEPSSLPTCTADAAGD